MIELLNEDDRFSLISFANIATILSPLQQVTESKKVELKKIFLSLFANYGTSIHSGMQ